MKRILFGISIWLMAALAHAAVVINNEPLGDGPPSHTMTVGTTKAYYWGDGLYFVPGYMPGWPTAATMWPRVVTVKCVKETDGTIHCDGYEIRDQQIQHRGEYILFRPIIVDPPKPPVVVTACPPPMKPIDPLQLLDKSIRQ